MKWPSESLNFSCAPGCGRSLRRASRVPVVHVDATSSLMASASQAPSRDGNDAEASSQRDRNGYPRLVLLPGIEDLPAGTEKVASQTALIGILEKPSQPATQPALFINPRATKVATTVQVRGDTP
jgi:hypothetical protein